MRAIAKFGAPIAGIFISGAIIYYNKKNIYAEQVVSSSFSWLPPSRKELLENLKKGDEFDLLIIGGGATGTGCALDAATRGLKVALVERDDFSCGLQQLIVGTSSRSTKLVHGGVRYLEKAFLEMDLEQYKLVKEALHERSTFLDIAPYLAYELPIMLPIHSWWKIPYYYVGAKAYDILAGSKGLSSSYYMSKTSAIEKFPMLKKDDLKGAIVYYDGAHNDSRMNVAIAMTAIKEGATVLNHVEVVELLKRPRTSFVGKFGFGNNELCGAIVRDTLTGETWQVKAKGVINATGPFCVAPSAGVHVILPNYFSPRNMGLLDPNTSDGRVIFFLPWQGSVIAGTTDTPTKVDQDPIPSDSDINWILKEDIKVRRGDVTAAWSGIRPLVRDPSAKNTAALVRNHMINVSENGLLTIAGGKWTTYRRMAEETIDKAIEVFGLNPTSPCMTTQTKLIGSHSWSKSMFIKLIQHFGLETEVAQHLSDNYGDRAWAVAAVASQTGSRWPIYGVRLAAGYPYLEAEVRYACQREYALTAVDVIARRTRLAFLNARACLEALPRVIEIMSIELGWDAERREKEYSLASNYLLTMGLSIKETLTFPGTSLNEDEAKFLKRNHFIPKEIERYKQIFNEFDKDMDGGISPKDFSKALSSLGIKIKEAEIKRIISEVDLNHSGAIEFSEFLEILAAVKDIRSHSKFSRIVADYQDRDQFPTDRSGGGV